MYFKKMSGLDHFYKIRNGPHIKFVDDMCHPCMCKETFGCLYVNLHEPIPKGHAFCG